MEPLCSNWIQRYHQRGLILIDTTGFDDKTIEKIYRICDILQRISLVEYTRERLSLYGGTSLNFLHFKNIPRLSLDIDFIRKYISTAKEKYQAIIDTFFDKHKFNPKLLKSYDILNPDINSHPSILWNLKKIKK